MAKKFFYVCAGLFLLAASYHLGAQRAVAQTATTALSPTEVVTLGGVLNNGETIPLPVYADGTTALESECSWTVSLSYISGAILDRPDEVHCSAPTRTVSVYACNGSPTCSNIQGGAANYLIVATRGAAGVTPAASRSWGALKVK